MMTKTTLLSLSIAAMLGTAAVEAKPFYIDVGRDYGNTGTKADGGTTTGWFDEALIRYWSTTYITDTNGDGFVNAGDMVRGTGGLLNEAQFGVGNSNLGENRVTAFSPEASFTNPSGPSNNGYGFPDWQLSFGWNDLMGTVTATGDITYYDGTISLFLFDAENLGGTGLEVMKIDVQSGGANAIGQSLDITGIVDFVDLDLAQQIGDSSTLGGLFNFDNGSFGDLWGEEIEISSFIDQNTSPFWFNGILQGGDFPDFSQLSFANGVGGQAILSGQHDGSIVFDVPEPTSIALLGIGLLGLGGAAWRRKAA